MDGGVRAHVCVRECTLEEEGIQIFLNPFEIAV